MMYSRRSVGVVRLALLGVVLVLGGCSLIPTTYEPPPPESDQVWDFISNCQDRWTYEADVYGEPCQDPVVSLQRMRGDCDDFAVMIACCVQEAFQRDTFIVFVNIRGVGLHAVAFMEAKSSELKVFQTACGPSYPYVNVDGHQYLSVDMTVCPTWEWTNPGERVYTWEWDKLVGKPLSLLRAAQAIPE